MDAPLPTLAVGIQFANFQQLKLACKRVALYDNFEYTVKKGDKKRYTIECCTGDNCPWRLHASLVTAESNCSEIVEIKTFIAEHTCFGVQHARHKQASSSFIGSAIQAKLQDRPSYRPTDVLNDM